MTADPNFALSGDDDFVRLPGLYRRWELHDVLDVGDDYHLEDAGEAPDGTPFFAVYRRQRTLPDDANGSASAVSGDNANSVNCNDTYDGAANRADVNGSDENGSDVNGSDANRTDVNGSSADDNTHNDHKEQ